VAAAGKRKLGKYEIERSIGKGSAANIYLARQNLLGRKLVIKELLPLHASNDKIIVRFQREARLASKLSHETIVHVYDYWVRNNAYFIAMEYVPGKTLKEILERCHHLPCHIAAVMVYQICRGLAEAHASGVVHRDLKPANVMISRTGQVKILDFGIAHFHQEEPMTALGAVLGTYHYMSPEQALGKAVTPASDLFSLGILFYEMLTGVKPFARDEKGDVLEKIVHKQPVRAARINPAVPQSFSRILRRCLRKKAKHRFQQARDIQVRLEKTLKQHTLDHQMILRQFTENLEKWEPGEHWPPKFWRRVVYRLTHLRKRVYIWTAVCLIILGGIEYGLLAGGVTLNRQWIHIKTAVVSVWNRVKGEAPEVENRESVPEGGEIEGQDGQGQVFNTVGKKRES